MKRIFTLAIIAMIATLSFAQAPVAVKSAAKKQIQTVMTTQQLQKGQAMKAAYAEKAKAAQETSGSVLRNAAKRPAIAKMQMKAQKPINGTRITRPSPMGQYSMSQFKNKKAIVSVQKEAAPMKVKNVSYNANAPRMATPKADAAPTEIVATDASAEYYAEDGDWYCVLQNSQNVFTFDIVTNDPSGLELNHEYTLADMDPNYSYCKVGGSNTKYQYTAATLVATEGAYGNDYEATATLSNGNVYHITYTSVAPETLDVEISTVSSLWYGEPDMDWFYVLSNANFEFRFDIINQVAEGLEIGHEYTLADMAESYSWGKNKATGMSIKYKTVSFKPLQGANGTDYAVTILDTKGNTYNITYTTIAPPEPTETVEIEFTTEETDLADASQSQGIVQFTGSKDNGLEAFVAFITNQVAGQYTYENVYPTYTGLYLDANDYDGVDCADLTATVTDLGNGAYKAVVDYLGANSVLYKLTFNYGEAEEPGPEPESDVVVTKDNNGIITSVTGGESKTYKRSGTAYFVSNSQMVYSDQEGVATVIKDAASGKVYINNPISRYTQGSWAEGVVEDGKIIVAAKQPLAYNTNYGTTISLRWGVVASTGSIAVDDAHADNFVYVIDGDKLILQGTESYATAEGDTYFMGAFWDDDNSATGYGDAETVLTYDPEYVGPSYDLVELPAGATTVDWYLNGSKVTSSATTAIKNQTIKTAFVGDDVYVQGIFTDMPNSWVKGTITGSAVTFAKGQYLGKYGTNDIWFMGVDPETAELMDATASYDAAKQEITIATDILANGKPDAVYYLTWLEDVVLTKDAKQIEEPVITNLTAELPYVNAFDTKAEQNEAAIYDANEDGKTFTFAEDNKSGSTTARYAYNTKVDADDYVVFPGLALEAGKSYKVSVDARPYGSSFPERLEVVAGTVAKASQLTIPVIAPTDLTTGDYQTLTAEFTPEVDGTYYIALHAISDANMFYLYTDNFSVKENNMSAPSAPANLVVTPDPEAKLVATIEFNAPAKTLAGDDITGDVQCVIKRDGEVINETTVAAGALVQFVDDAVPAPGNYTYSVVATVDGISSDAVSVKAYVGEDVPNDVENLEAKDMSGKVALSWDAVTEGMNNGIIIPENVRYNVYPVEMIDFFGMQFPAIDYENPYALEIAETSYDVEFDTNAGEQGYTYFGVSASNSAGESGGAMNAALTGAPYELPIHEDLADGLSYWWGVEMDDNNYSLSQLDDVGLYVGEDNSFEFIAGVQGWISLLSGKIALNGSENAALTFDAKGAANFIVSAYGPTSETPITMQVAGGADYANVTFPLSELADQPWVRFEIKADFENAGEANVTNVNVLDLVANDLDIVISAPKSVTAGKSAVVKATVTNKGQETAENYAVKFYVNDEELPTPMFETPALAFFESAEFEAELATSIFDEAGDVTVKVVVEYAMDEKEDNNSDETIVSIVAPSATPVESAAAEVDGKNVVVNWTVAEVTTTEVTDDFESYDSFAYDSFGEWSAVSVDGQTTGGFFTNYEYPHQGEPFGWMVFSPEEVFEGLVDANPTMGSHSGDKYLMAPYGYIGETFGDNDKWLFSPELPGIAQTVKFYAGSIDADYPSTIEILYSTTDKSIESFTKIKTVSLPCNDDYGWIEVTAELPEGATYFAIRDITDGDHAFMTRIDDVTYTVGGAAPVAFNIYLDGAIEATVEGDVTTYTIEDVESGEHVVSVSAVYANGTESAPVSTTVDVTTGIQNINVNDAKAEIYSVNGVRVQKANKPGVYVINGRKAVVK